MTELSQKSLPGCGSSSGMSAERLMEDTGTLCSAPPVRIVSS